MTPVVGTSSVVFHSYNDDLGTLDDVINGVREKLGTRQTRTPGSTSLHWAGAFRILSMVEFDRIEESFCRLARAASLPERHPPCLRGIRWGSRIPHVDHEKHHFGPVMLRQGPEFARLLLKHSSSLKGRGSTPLASTIFSITFII
jgi:hypothetical protein